MRSTPERSRLIARRGPSMTSSFSRSSSSGTDVHETIISSFGSSRSGVGLARTRSTTRKPSTTSFGFQPSQPVDSIAISTGCPSWRESRLASVSRYDSICGNTTKRTTSERQRERRETDDDDGPDEPDQRVGRPRGERGGWRAEKA